jgi:hypothetical protein
MTPDRWVHRRILPRRVEMTIHDWTRVSAGIFHDFRHEWISTLKRTLNQGLLPLDYYALAEQIAGGMGPDVLTLETSPVGAGRAVDEDLPKGDIRDRGGIDVATAPPKVHYTAMAEMERYASRRSRIAIRHISDDNIVALVEILSPGNKSSRHALRSFVEKTAELLEAGIHLLVLDLFPPGRRDPEGIHAAIWGEIMEDDFRLPRDKRLTLAAYSAGDVVRAFIEPVAVGDLLPDMPLFLVPGVYVPVPLERSYQSAFEAVPKRWQDALGTS